MIYEGDCGVIGGANDDCRGNRSTRRKPAQRQFVPPQIPHDQVQFRTPDRSGGKPATNRLSYGAALALQLLIVLSHLYKWSINPFTNPNPVYIHTPSREKKIYTACMCHIYFIKISDWFGTEQFYLVYSHLKISRHFEGIRRLHLQARRIIGARNQFESRWQLWGPQILLIWNNLNVIYCDVSGLMWLIIMDSGFHDWIYWHFFTITVDYSSSHVNSFWTTYVSHWPRTDFYSSRIHECAAFYNCHVAGINITISNSSSVLLCC
jgi:hypothetical protein